LRGRVNPDNSKRDEGMEERRRTPRMKDENEVTITAVSGEKNIPKEKIIDEHFNDISVLGARIQTSILLPIDSLLELDFTSKGVSQQINILGKVKWGKVVIDGESYEMGVEFYPSKAMEKLEDHISWKLKSNKSESIKNKLPPTDSGDIKILETKKPSSVDSGDIKIVKTKKLPPVKNKQWIKIAMLSLSTIILIVVLLTTFGFIPELDRMLVPNIITKAKPAPEIKPVPLPEATSAPAPVLPTAPEITAAPAPAPEAMQKTKVIGNSDSKRYHLPGMKYYNSVKAYHRVEFDSETDAVKAGYKKAPQ
jgi:hypothetical protein